MLLLRLRGLTGHPRILRVVVVDVSSLRGDVVTPAVLLRERQYLPLTTPQAQGVNARRIFPVLLLGPFLERKQSILSVHVHRRGSPFSDSGSSTPAASRRTLQNLSAL